jgi:dipeptidyl-peptidase-4
MSLKNVVEYAASGALTADDYARAERFLPWNKDRYVINGDIQHHWIGNDERFWYLRTNSAGEKEFVVTDAASGAQMPAFDHQKVADALSRLTGKKVEAGQLPFSSFRYVQNNTAIQFRFAEKLWTCQLRTSTCVETSPDAAANEAVSPDGRWAAFLKDRNVWVRPISGGAEFPLTMDGIEHYGYAASPGISCHPITDIRHPKPTPPQVIWSPDSRYLLTHRLDERNVNDLFLIQSVPEDGGIRPKLYKYRYSMPGDEHLPLLEPVVFDVATRRQVNLLTRQLVCFSVTLIEKHDTWWSVDGKTVYYLHRDRFSKSVCLNRADPATGAVSEVLRETSDTVVYTNANFFDFPAVRTLKNGDVIWYSPRSGWGHLYYYGRDGALRHQITRGEWTVRGIVRVDEADKSVYFMGSGREEGRDPYERRLYSIQFDGSGLRLLTPEEAEHEPRAQSLSTDDKALTAAEVAERNAFSPSGRYFIDSYSRPDRPPVLVLRAADGRLIKQLEEADISKLRAGGYTPIEPFQVLAADGKTAIYGNLFRPSMFDPARKYPIIDANYPGPQTIRSRKRFSAAVFDDEEAQGLAELGFIVITIDGRGTPNRSRAFLDYSYGRLDKASDIADHITGIRQLAQRYPYMDVDRVGIYGISGGGFRAAQSILAYPDFYKVAVSSEGNHDQRGNLTCWGETYNGPVDQSDYLASSTPPLAAHLKGKLLLMHGEMDDNVSPTLTMKLIDALIKANKDFDLLIMPNENHDTAFKSPYFIRRKWDYFVRHLLGGEPPANYAITPPQMSHRAHQSSMEGHCGVDMRLQSSAKKWRE